jgi:hypothetical protein
LKEPARDDAGVLHLCVATSRKVVRGYEGRPQMLSPNAAYFSYVFNLLGISQQRQMFRQNVEPGGSEDIVTGVACR